MRDLIASYLAEAWQYVAAVGWYVVGIVVVSLYLAPQIQEKYNNWRRKKDDLEYAAKYHKDPDVYQERLTKMEEARQKMQEKYIADAEKARQKEQERIEKKRQALLELTQEKSSGQRLGQASEEPSTSSSKSNSSSTSLKGGYNPLMGDSSGSYRAPKRSCCGKGGCG